MELESIFFVVLLTFIVFVVAPAVVFHYITQWRKAGSLLPEQERMLEDVWHAARSMERRVDVLEAILDEEAPNWRRRHPQIEPVDFDAHRKRRGR